MASIVDSVTHIVLIIDTTLRLFIPSQVRKMTPKLRQICGCELCIITKNMNNDLNISRTRPVKDFQQKYVGRHTGKILFITTSDAH